MQILSFPAHTLADSGHVNRCHNLRPSLTGGLQIVGQPQTAARFNPATRNHVMLGNFTYPDGTECMLHVHDGWLWAWTKYGEMKVEELDCQPSCALPLDDSIIIMPAHGMPRRFTYSLQTTGWIWDEAPLFNTLPPLMIERRDMSVESVQMPALTLGNSYTATTRHLADDDQATVDQAMRRAYLNLSDCALSHGRFIQPVTARYRLLDYEGRVLYTSAPVLVAPDSGLQGVNASLHLSGDGFRSVDSAKLTATSFEIALRHTREPDDVWDSLVHTVQLLVTPQIHPYSSTLPGHTSLTAASASQLTLSATLPGVDPLVPHGDAGTRTEACIAAMIDEADSMFAVQSLPPDTATELRWLQALTTQRHTASDTDYLSVMLSPPHSFSAAAVARSGDLVAWGNLTVTPFDGYSLPEFAISATAASPTTATPTAVKVTMRDGSSVVRSAISLGWTDLLLSPLIIYPSPDAVEVTLIAGNKSITFPLTPTPQRRATYYLNPSLTPIQFTDTQEGYVVPAASPRIRHFPSALAICPAADPLTPLAVSYGEGGTLHALLPALRYSNSFTVPSARFYVAGSEGISTMTLSTSRSRINLSLLDPRGVEGPRCVTAIPGGMAAVAGGSLLSITGAKPVTLLDSCKALMLGWCNHYGELWCIPSDGETDITVVRPDDGSRFTRTNPGVTDLLSTGSAFRMVTADGNLLDTSVEEDAPATVEYSVTQPHSLPPGSYARVALPLFGTDVNGEIKISASHGAPARASADLCTLTLSGGNLNHPLDIPLRIPHSHTLTLSLNVECRMLNFE